MKRTHKKVAGFLGLLVVVAITAIAAFLPTPKTQAAVTTVTDTLTVRVVNNTPNVDIVGIDSGEIIVVPRQSFVAQWQNAQTVTVKMTHTDLDGNSREYLLDTIDADFYDGQEEYNIQFIK